jgi:hypothetical protein
MDDNDLNKQIEDLKRLIETEEVHYKISLLKQAKFDTVKEMRGHIRELKHDLQILLDMESVKETAELPKDTVD